MDRLRGLAIVLMLVDHSIAVLGGPIVLRATVTRLALPLFMVAAAVMFRGRLSRRSCVRLVAAVAVEAVLSQLLGLPAPGILAIYLPLVLVVGLAWPLVVAHPGVTLTLGLISALYVPVGWHGYEPGLVLAWFCLGLLARLEWFALGDRLPVQLERVGRRPLIWYVGHLVVLTGIAAVI